MMSETSVAIEISADAPRVPSRLVLENHTPIDALKRILREFGIEPVRLAFRQGDGEVAMFGRDRHTNEVVSYGSIFYGLTLTELNAAKADLIAANWSPSRPQFTMPLPDGRVV